MDGVKVNGFPKCGVHALSRACTLLGVSSDIRHDEYVPTKTKSIFIKRQPKDVVISSLRWNQIPVNSDSIIAHIKRFEHQKCSNRIYINRYETLSKSMSRFEGWLSCPETLTVKFETIEQEFETIANFIGRKFNPRLIKYLRGHTHTWNNQNSIHTDYWNTEIEEVWESYGGRELCDRWGY